MKLICLGRSMASFFRLDVRGGEKPDFCTADDGGCTLMNADEFWMCGVVRNRVFSRIVGYSRRYCQKPGF
ncbi:MAG: hypothetical protein P2A85_07015 [Microcoleus anatoxicus]|uniref:hypothetical protein n=1 Tax=Microcoleus anatoxicus TaxID=2705319 RepID=UPI003670D1B2